MDIVDRFYRILSNHHMPAYKAREILCYKSPNSLTRIVQRNVSQDLMLDFAQRLIEHADELLMTEEELNGIREGAEELSQGLGNMTAYRQFMTLLHEGASAPAAAQIRTAAFAARPQTRAFDPQGVTKVRCTMLGCCPGEWLAAIAALEGQAALDVDFYYEETDSPLPAVQMLEAILPYIHKPWFHPYRVRRDRQPSRLAGCMVVLDLHRGDKAESLMLIPQEGKPAIRVALAESHPDPRVLFLEPTAEATSVRWFEKLNDDMLTYLRALEKRERNHRAILIKEDPSFQLVPPAIQMAALKKELVDASPELQKLMPQLQRVQTARYENALSKKYHQHMVLSMDGMRRFAQTGCLSDHPWLMRPFTQAEVLKILTELQKHLSQSRYLHLYFLKDPNLKLGEVGWFEGCGVCFSLPHTDYQMAKNDIELEIHDRGFESFFSGFLLRHLTTDAVYTPEESRQMLASLVEEVRARVEA